MRVHVLRLSLGFLGLLALATGPAAGVQPHRHDVLPGPVPYITPSTPLAPGTAPSEAASVPWAGDSGGRPGAMMMRVLVISADGNEPSFQAAMAALDEMGIPAQAFIATRDGPLTPDKLVQGDIARYYAVILATSTLAYGSGPRYATAFSAQDWATLAAFESRFRIRRLMMYTYPDPEYGFQAVSGSGPATKTARLTAEGRRIFSYLKPDADIVVRNAWLYRARPAPGAVPLLVTPDGDALAVVKRFPDGRETLGFAMDSNAWLLHTRLLIPGAITWVTRGVYLGERRVYLNPQVDDLFFDDDRYAGPPYRITAAELEHAALWQRAVRTQPLTKGFRLALAFNGEGSEHFFVPQTATDPDPPVEPTEDPLTDEAVRVQDQFEWISHTYAHTNLDATTEPQTEWELRANDLVAQFLGFTHYSRETLVTPDISGFQNQAAMLAAARRGVRYVVSDWSRADQRAPRFNTGIRNAYEPRILEIPRYPTNIFYNVTEPGELVEEFLAIHPDFCRLFPDRCPLTYERLLDFESDTQLGYLFTYDINPMMFHQANLREYATGHTLLADLFAALLAKYEALSALPIRTLSMAEIGRAMERRAAYDDAGIVGILVPGEQLSVTATNGPATVPITGVRAGAVVERYGSEETSYLSLARGERAVIPLR
jgi:hypothetical protein